MSAYHHSMYFGPSMDFQAANSELNISHNSPQAYSAAPGPYYREEPFITHGALTRPAEAGLSPYEGQEEAAVSPGSYPRGFPTVLQSECRRDQKHGDVEIQTKSQNLGLPGLPTYQLHHGMRSRPTLSILC